MIDFQCCPKYGIDDYVRIVELLRSEEGCPWDRAQTHESIKKNLIEEALEVTEAIDEKNAEHLLEELGDLMMQVVFHAQIEREQGSFDFDDVCDAACRKLLKRHPHVFGNVQVKDQTEALKVWEETKRVEHKQETRLDAMKEVAKTLPATWQMEKLIKKSGDTCEDADTRLTAAAISAAGGDDESIGRLVLEAARLAAARGADFEAIMLGACKDYISSFESEQT